MGAADEPFYDEVTEHRIDAGGPRSAAADRRSSRRVAGVRKASGVGAVLTGIAMGLQEVFYPEDEEIAMVMIQHILLPHHFHYDLVDDRNLKVVVLAPLVIL